MTTPETIKPTSSGDLILSAEMWLTADFSAQEKKVIIGTPDNPLVRPLTKNIIQAPEKAFKTTFLLRLALATSAGETVFPSLPVEGQWRLLYLHGELAPTELKQRLQEAATGLKRPLENFFQGRSLTASLVTEQGRDTIRRVVNQHKPEILVIDPWQSFIAGAEENSFKEISDVGVFLDKLISECGVTLLLAIHLGKDHTRGARGHSFIAGWRDTMFALKRSENSLKVSVDPRWASPIDLELQFKEGTLWEGNAPKWSKQASRIRDLITANGGQLSRDQLSLGLDLKDSSLRMAINRAKDAEAISVEGEIIKLGE